MDEIGSRRAMSCLDIEASGLRVFEIVKIAQRHCDGGRLMAPA